MDFSLRFDQLKRVLGRRKKDKNGEHLAGCKCDGDECTCANKVQRDNDIITSTPLSWKEKVLKKRFNIGEEAIGLPHSEDNKEASDERNILKEDTDNVNPVIDSNNAATMEPTNQVENLSPDNRSTDEKSSQTTGRSVDRRSGRMRRNSSRILSQTVASKTPTSSTYKGKVDLDSACPLKDLDIRPTINVPAKEVDVKEKIDQIANKLYGAEECEQKLKLLRMLVKEVVNSDAIKTKEVKTIEIPSSALKDIDDSGSIMIRIIFEKDAKL